MAMVTSQFKLAIINEWCVARANTYESIRSSSNVTSIHYMEEKNLHSENWIIVNFLQKSLFPSKRKEPHTSFEKKNTNETSKRWFYCQNYSKIKGN
jgi:hypothetical protein